ncbi:MAG: FAD binding domain-containing protein [Chloroflexi bacterium]|nr:FAD binding domain-containing protein [Chloroflexota bacterium]
MITDYHRPQTLDEALTLLAQPNTVPLGGGTLLSWPQADSVEVVDLQALGINQIKKNGNSPSTSSGQRLEIGATVTLQQLMENENCPEALKRAIKLEAPLNIRNAATVAGAIAACDGRSTFVTALLALDAKLEQAILPFGYDVDNSKIEYRMSNIGDFIPLRPRGLITSITIPVQTEFAFEYVSRTPADKPIVCVALARWNSGRTRLALGGYGKSPMLAMDGPHSFPSPSGRGTEGEGIEAAARNAFHEAKDEWASAEYRMDIAATLAKRCMDTTQ